MPFKTIQRETLDLVIHEGHGSISHEDIRAELSTCFGESGWVRHSLWDLRDANLTLLTSGQVVDLAKNAKAYAKKNTGKKNAWVATSPADFGLCRMSEMVADGSGLYLGVFYDFDEAMTWIQSISPTIGSRIRSTR